MTGHRILRAYVDTALRGSVMQTHYRETGRGLPLVALHPSPMSSAFLVPVMEALRDACRVIAPDTPGYGVSDPLPEPDDGLGPYVEWLDAFVDALELEEFLLYGSATGAQIAIEYAKSRPKRVRHLILETAVHFTDEECADIMENYFPDIRPREDGSHLQTVWEIAQGLFRGFPWYEYSGSDLDLPKPPLELVNATALAYLNAGADYHRAYRAAFANERAENLMKVPVPTTVTRWSGSVLKTYADRLDQWQWPEHIQMLHSEGSPQARFATLREHVHSLVNSPTSN